MEIGRHDAAPGAPNAWTLRYGAFSPGEEGLRESLCALGNGYVMTRAAAPEADADDVHYPGTYIAGVYDRAVSRVAGRRVENEDLVNLPNWLPLTFRTEDGPWFGGSADEIIEHHVTLDLRHGMFTRYSRVRDAEGRVTELTQRRLVHMVYPHLAALETTLVPENWSGTLTVRSAIDGGVRNLGVARYRGLTDAHLGGCQKHAVGDDTILLGVETRSSRVRVAVAARTGVTLGGPATRIRRWSRQWSIGQDTVLGVTAGDPVVVEKIVAIHTGRDPAIAAPATAACEAVADAGDFEALQATHVRRWAELWARCRLDLDLGRDLDGDVSVRLYTFHILQTLSAHTAGLDAGVPARGLNGEAYRGHVFWDELFVLPYLNLRLPDVSRGLLGYRYRRLDAARRAAREAGFRGAMFPWQSGSDGREETPTLHFNPRSGRWLDDHSHLQRHVGSAVAYNAWSYYQATGDDVYLAAEGAELLVEVARFWADIVVFDPVLDRYRIRGVMGPDEYHDAYPWAAAPGLDDNAYTNVLASWVLRTAERAVSSLPEYRRDELVERLGLHAGERIRWEHVARKLRVCFHDGVISQFHRYGDLAELDWDAYRNRYGDIRRLDRILEAEGDTPNRYKASKQADVLMLSYLFSPRELSELLDHMGYRADAALLDRTTRYYLDRTAHGSTLSSVVHAWVLARSDRVGSGRFLREALASDSHDIQGGTTAEGIHLGAMAGCLDLLTRGYPGLEVLEDELRVDPVLPTSAGSLAFPLRYRGHWGVRVHITRRMAAVTLRPGRFAPIKVRIQDVEHVVEPGDTLRVPLTPTARQAN